MQMQAPPGAGGELVGWAAPLLARHSPIPSPAGQQDLLTTARPDAPQTGCISQGPAAFPHQVSICSADPRSLQVVPGLGGENEKGLEANGVSDRVQGLGWDGGLPHFPFP